MSLIIAGDRSSAGKTTVTLSILAALCRRMGKRNSQSNSAQNSVSNSPPLPSPQVQTFKVGPDYIDPMFHRYVTGRPCRNLDVILTSETYVQQCFAHHSQGADYAIVEGVMGLFDGAGGTDQASTAHVARLLNQPILLVLDCRSLSTSVAAIALGYRTYDPSIRIAGVVLNRVGSDRHLSFLKAALEPLELPILGVLRFQEAIAIPDRHLGLVPTDELPTLEPVIEQLADLGLACFDWDHLLPLLQANSLEVSILDPSQKAHYNGPNHQNDPHLNSDPKLEFDKAYPALHACLNTDRKGLRIAIAQDKAFNFYYEENLELLEQLGAELVYWSPLNDTSIPVNIHGLYLGGGFPEMFAQALSDNQGVRDALRQIIQEGMPTYAECGGLMYLSKAIVDFDGRSWPMVGIVPSETRMDKRLTLGYRHAKTLKNSPILSAGTVVWGHEFHRSSCLPASLSPLFSLQPYRSDLSTTLSTTSSNISPSPETWEGWQCYHVHASYLHLHWGSNPEIPQRFLHYCQEFSGIAFSSLVGYSNSNG